jgi:uncharacterized protein
MGDVGGGVTRRLWSAAARRFGSVSPVETRGSAFSAAHGVMTGLLVAAAMLATGCAAAPSAAPSPTPVAAPPSAVATPALVPTATSAPASPTPAATLLPAATLSPAAPAAATVAPSPIPAPTRAPAASPAVATPTPTAPAPAPTPAPNTPSPVASPASTQEATHAMITTSDGRSVRVDLEIANTPQERAVGLSRRESLQEQVGMLFVWPAEQHGAFWMKDTFIPLSIAFISDDGRIMEIQDMEPLSEELHVPARPYRYALEVNQGFFDRNGIAAGDRVELQFGGGR